MGVLGTFGDVVFEVSSQRIHTFNDFTREASARFEEHQRILQKPKLEFLGPEADQITFRMRFDVSFGITDVKAEMDKLLRKCREGKAETLLIGGVRYGLYKWVVESVRQTMKVFDGQGRLISGEVEATLREYVL